MKTIGLIGGSTWVSTAEYYRTLNKLTQEKLGYGYSASILLYSIKFHEFKGYLENGEGEKALGIWVEGAKTLEQAGAHCLLLGANTPHMYVPELVKHTSLPIVHIGEETAKTIKANGLKTVGLLGTKPTMEMDFYKDKLSNQGIQTLIPNESDRDFIHQSIFNEFSRDIFSPETRERYVQIIRKLKDQGAEGAILGCTEIPMLVKQSDSPIPVFDTMQIHCEAAVNFAN